MCCEFLPWENFDKKSGGKNGCDSRCKACISSLKSKTYLRKVKKKKRDRVLSASLNPRISGYLTQEAIDRFAGIFSASLQELIDDGSFKIHTSRRP
jgi:hypothetical protein